MNLILCIIGLFVSFGLSLKRQWWGIYLVLLCLPLYVIRTSIGPIPTTFIEMILAGLAASWFVLNSTRLKAIFHKLWETIRKNWFFSITVSLFVLSATIGIFIAPDKMAALGVWRAYIIEPIIFFALAVQIVDTPKKMRGAWTMLLVSGLCIAVFAIIQKFTGWYIPETWIAERRVTSIFPFPNAVGLYLAPLIAASLPLARYYSKQDGIGGRVRAIATLACAFIMFLAIICSQTEAALVALAVIGFVYGIAFAGRKIRYATILLAILAGIAVYTSAPLQHLLQEKLLLQDWSGFVRRTVWHESIAMLSDHPIFGAGLSGYQHAMVPYHKATYMEIFMFPHDIVLNIWTELGLLGLLATALMMAWGIASVVRVIRALKKHQSLDADWHRTIIVMCVLSIVAMIIHGLVDVPYFKNDLSILTWFIIACLFATSSKFDTIHTT